MSSYPAKKGTRHPDAEPKKTRRLEVVPSPSKPAAEPLRFLNARDWEKGIAGLYGFRVSGWRFQGELVALDFILKMGYMGGGLPTIQMLDPSDETRRAIGNIVAALKEPLLLDKALENSALAWILHHNTDATW